MKVKSIFLLFLLIPCTAKAEWSFLDFITLGCYSLAAFTLYKVRSCFQKEHPIARAKKESRADHILSLLNNAMKTEETLHFDEEIAISKTENFEEKAKEKLEKAKEIFEEKVLHHQSHHSDHLPLMPPSKIQKETTREKEIDELLGFATVSLKMYEAYQDYRQTIKYSAATGLLLAIRAGSYLISDMIKNPSNS